MAKAISFPRATTFAHQLIRERLAAGDVAVDATVGNGHDTVFLSRCVGPEGRVFGFDIQQVAIDSAKVKLESEKLGNVTFFAESHDVMAEKITEPIGAAMFNLGYFPGGDKTLITRPESTIKALNAACDLGPKIITVAVYHGHEGGESEASAVSGWAESLDQTQFTVIRYEFLNQKNSPPFLIAVERR